MKKKIEKIVKNIDLAVTSKGNKEVTRFLRETTIFIPIKNEKEIYVKKEEMGVFVPVYMENTEGITKEVPVLHLLVFLSKNKKLDGLDFIHENKSVSKLILKNNKFINWWLVAYYVVSISKRKFLN